MSSFRVLIETLWNVKECGEKTKLQELKRINRNIVECKVAKGYMEKDPALVLIETLWNVKKDCVVVALKMSQY